MLTQWACAPAMVSSALVAIASSIVSADGRRRTLRSGRRVETVQLGGRLAHNVLHRLGGLADGLELAARPARQLNAPSLRWPQSRAARWRL